MKAIALIVILGMTGCAASKAPPDRTTPMIADDYVRAVASSQPSYPPARVSSSDFDALWQAVEKSLEARMFRIDRRDYRAGLLTTYPLISRQFFEFWRRDTLGIDDVTESSLNSMRRTVRVEIEHHEETGMYVATPRVEVERYSDAGRRLTSAAMYRTAFKRTTARGTPESDAGINLQSRYWYTVGSDERLEAAIVRAAQKRLAAH